MENLLEAPKSVLLVKLSSIGDVVMASPVAEAIRRAYPDVFLAWLVEDRCRPVLEGNPYLDEIISWPRPTRFGPALRIIRKLRSHHFDFSVDLQGLAKSSALAYLSGAKKRVGFAKGRECSALLYNAPVECGRLPHSMDCYRALLGPLGTEASPTSPRMCFPISDQDMVSARELLESVGIKPEHGFAALAPATTRDAKHWIEERWSELADELSSKFGLSIVFLGSRADTDMLERIRSRMHVASISLAGQTTLKTAGAVIKESQLMVSVDTGLMHIAVALGVPTIAVYGPTSAWENHIHNANFRVARKDLPCAPCHKRVTCTDFDCMLAVSVEDVITLAAELLADNPQADTVEESSLTC
jgi:heptosyltransferase I